MTPDINSSIPQVFIREGDQGRSAHDLASPSAPARSAGRGMSELIYDPPLTPTEARTTDGAPTPVAELSAAEQRNWNAALLEMARYLLTFMPAPAAEAEAVAQAGD